MRWACAELTTRHPGTGLPALHTLTTLPPELHGALPATHRHDHGPVRPARPRVEEYHLNLLRPQASR